MNTPLYKRRWFLIGLLFIISGVFTYALAVSYTAKYESEFPELAKKDREVFLQKLKTGDIREGMNDAQQEKLQNRIMLHGLYQKYYYVGIVFMVLGVICMLLSTKEPQVPMLEDEDEFDSPEEKTSDDKRV